MYPYRVLGHSLAANAQIKNGGGYYKVFPDKEEMPAQTGICCQSLGDSSQQGSKPLNYANSLVELDL